MPGPIDYSLINVKPDPDTKEWWDGTKEDRLLVRLCNDCGHKFFPPFPACPGCTSMDLGWHQAKGTGVIYSYNVVVQPILAPFVGRRSLHNRRHRPARLRQPRRFAYENRRSSGGR